MRLAALILVLIVSVVSCLSAHDWSSVAAQVEESLVRVTFPCMAEKGDHVCAGFVIGDRYVLTDYHCIIETLDGEKVNPPKLYLDGFLVDVLQAFPDDDLVVLNYEGIKPPLDYRRKPIRKGAPVAALGFAYGLGTSTLLTGVIAAPAADWGKEGRWVTVDRPLVGGMSGGPIFDEEGKVVAISQMTDDLTGTSRELSVILKRTKKYWNRFSNPGVTPLQPAGMPLQLIQGYRNRTP